MKNIKKGMFYVILVCVCLSIIYFTSCATTHSVNFASAEQPKGEYKYVLISANSLNGSVLQRFYSQFPSDKYEIIAYELQSKRILPFLGGFVGSAVGFMISINSSSYDIAQIVIPISVAIFGTFGYFIGNEYKDNYLITYIERISP